MVYVGIDLHRRTSHVAAFDEEGLELLSRRVTKDPEVLRALFVELGGEARVALEAAFRLGVAGRPARRDGNGGWVVLELNGAVDFTPEYGLGGEGVFERVVHMLARPLGGDTESSGPRVSELSGERLRGWRSLVRFATSCARLAP